MASSSSSSHQQIVEMMAHCRAQLGDDAADKFLRDLAEKQGEGSPFGDWWRENRTSAIPSSVFASDLSNAATAWSSYDYSSDNPSPPSLSSSLTVSDLHRSLKAFWTSYGDRLRRAWPAVPSTSRVRLLLTVSGGKMPADSDPLEEPERERERLLLPECTVEELQRGCNLPDFFAVQVTRDLRDLFLEDESVLLPSLAALGIDEAEGSCSEGGCPERCELGGGGGGGSELEEIGEVGGGAVLEAVRERRMRVFTLLALVEAAFRERVFKEAAEGKTEEEAGTRESCASCGKEEGEGKNGALLRCSRCVSEAYCGSECQVKAWKLHKKVCGK